MSLPLCGMHEENLLICLQREWQPGLSTPPCPIPAVIWGGQGIGQPREVREQQSDSEVPKQSMLTAPTATRVARDANPTTAGHPLRGQECLPMLFPGRETQTPITPGPCVAQIQNRGSASSPIYIPAPLLPLHPQGPQASLSQSLPNSWS